MDIIGVCEVTEDPWKTVDDDYTAMILKSAFIDSMGRGRLGSLTNCFGFSQISSRNDVFHGMVEGEDTGRIVNWNFDRSLD